MKISTAHKLIIGLFLILSGSILTQCAQKEDEQISEEEWALLPSDGPYLSTYERILCSPEATKPELYAAGEFQRLFKEFTGKELNIEKSGSKNGKNILIGAKTAASSGFKADTDGLGEEGFNIEIFKDKLAIYGGAPRGTLYGVYEFFERYCGVRYLTYDHTYYPAEGKDKDFRIKGRSYSYVPPFAFRWSYYGETNQNPAFAAQLRTNTVAGPEELGGITGYKLVGHNVAYLVPPAVYGKDHPEYYALVDGRRVLAMHGGGPQLCLTNPDVLEIVVKATLDAIEKNPKAVEYLKENVKLNKVEDKIKVFEGDVKEVLPKLNVKADRILMPLPKTGELFLDLAFKYVKNNGIVHYYCFGSEKDIKVIKEKIVSVGKEFDKDVEFLGVFSCGAFSPRIYRFCIDFRVKPKTI